MVPLPGGDCTLLVMLVIRDDFHLSSGIVLAHSGMAEFGSVMPDMTCLMRSTCAKDNEKENFYELS